MRERESTEGARKVRQRGIDQTIYCTVSKDSEKEEPDGPPIWLLTDVNRVPGNSRE